MYEFEYHRPSKLADAVKLIKSKKEGKLMSGGMTLIPTMKQRLAAPTDVIDLSGLGNSGVSVTKTKVTIKAGTTHAEVATDAALKKAVPALAALAGMIGDPHVRHRGHHRRFCGQRRSGGGLSGSLAGAQCQGGYGHSYHRGRQVLQEPV